ncbi:MAG TPA: hypothetical protein VJL80_05090 [Aeromicrobium sp.]|nr:hypothetical protein [Aeromicrobium sp.]HKY57393.1 hypothetical protein [Aeromicrobium sp.]
MTADGDSPAEPRPAAGSFAQAPFVLVLVAACVAVAGLAMTFVGAGQTGLSGDEFGHVKRLEGFYDDGLFVRNWERTTPEGVIPPNAYVYSPGTTRIMHIVNVLAGNEGTGEVSTTLDAFMVRHYVVAVMALIGLLATAGLAWLLLGWRWAVVAAGALAAIPMWTGHAMFNPKDTPVAVGYTVMTLALAGLVLASAKNRRTAVLAGGMSCAAAVFGIVLMVGTRPGMWPAVAAALVMVVVPLAIGRCLNFTVLIGLAASLVVSYAALWKLYPKVFGDPLAMLSGSMGQSTQFPHGLAAGRHYIFERTAIEWPVLLLAFMLVGTVVAAVMCLRSMRSDSRRAVVLGLIGAQAYALTLAAVIVNANIYDGLRQLLFAVPAQALLATIGIAAVATFVARRGRAGGAVGVGQWVFAGVAIAALVLPTIVQARLYPYQYAYGNVVAEWTGASILNDNWKVSFREYVLDVPQTVKAACPNDPPEGPPINPDDYSDCRGNSKAFSAPWVAYWHHARFDPDSRTFYTLLRAQRPVPPNCRVVDKVVRTRNFERAVMSRLLLCTQRGVK